MMKDKGDLSRQEVRKLVSDKWKSLAEDEKKQYIDQSEADKQRYTEEQVEYDQKAMNAEEWAIIPCTTIK